MLLGLASEVVTSTMGSIRLLLLCVGVSHAILGCTDPLFPHRSLSGATIVHDLGETPVHQRVIVGGFIVEVQHADAYLLSARQLPLQAELQVGPLDTARPGVPYVVQYEGKVDEPALDWRNLFIAMGELLGVHEVNSEGMLRRLPVVQAECLHIWRTQTFLLSDFPYLGTGYQPLRHDTYCVSDEKN